MSTKSLKCLINEPLKWLLTPHGDGYALGWEGPLEYRSRAYNLFVNYLDYDRAPPRLISLHDNLSYIYAPSIESIKRALTLFFHVEGVRNGEVEVKRGWVGEGDDAEYVFEADEIKAEELALQSTQAFMSHIQWTGFVPPLPKPYENAYAMGWFPPTELVTIEDYATWASA